MLLYKNTKVKVHSPDGDTDFFDIVGGMLQGDTLVPYLFIICLDYVLWKSIDSLKENGFTLAKERSRRYSSWKIIDMDYTEDIALLVNTPVQAKVLQYILEQAAGGLSLHVNANKTEFMCFNQRGVISTINGRSLRFVDIFTYLRSSIISTENDINMQLVKAWTAINKLSAIWKLDLSDKTKHSFFPGSSCVNTAVWMHHMDTD